MVSQEFIQEVLDRTDIVDLISSYIPLKRAGANFKAHCPFHNEKTPSFIVSPQKQIYHCFGCGKGGNAIHFLMEYEKLTFYECLAMLAERAGLKMPRQEKIDRSTSDFLYRINEVACKIYENRLWNRRDIIEYLKKRGLQQEHIKFFKLGFAPSYSDFILSNLRSKKVPLSFIEKSGLVSSRPEGGYRDLLRNRIIIPIQDIKSRVIGFGGRRIEGDDTESPKYINSPETEIYHKRRVLFGLNYAKEFIVREKRAVLVEGYFDVIVPFSRGFKTIVAPLGTSLTVEQARFLKRYTRNIVLLFDSDEAGINATMRAIEVLFSEGIYPRIVAFPEGEDPASFVLKYGIKEFEERIARAEEVLDFVLQYFTKIYGTSTEGKREIVSQLFSLFSHTDNLIVLNDYLRRVSSELKVEEKAVFTEFDKFRSKARRPERMFLAGHRRSHLLSPEKILLAILLRNPLLVSLAKEKVELSDFTDEEVREVVSFLYNAGEADSIRDRPHLLFADKPELSSLISELEFMDIEEPERELSECIRRISISSKERLCRMLKDDIVEAEKRGETVRQVELLDKYNRLKRVIEYEKKEIAKRC